MPNSVTLKGNPIPVEGTELKPGDKAPDFKASKSLVDDCSLTDFLGKTVIISSVPSLDTPVCDTSSRRFNEEAGKLGDAVAVVTVSCDLPPAQARWCGAADAKNLVVASDYKHHDFGKKYGVWIPKLGVNARAVFVIGPDGTVKHAEYVPEIAQEPNYDAALSAAKG
jgi:thiol peroxidase